MLAWVLCRGFVCLGSLISILIPRRYLDSATSLSPTQLDPGRRVALSAAVFCYLFP
jgi:hypothetical protein